MNEFTDILFIFILVFVLLHFSIIDVNEFNTDNIILQKIYIFVAVTLFSSLLELIKLARMGCRVEAWNILSKGLLTGMFAYIGHTLLIDLTVMDSSRELIEGFEKDYFPLKLILALFITFAVIISRTFMFMFRNDYTYCR